MKTELKADIILEGASFYCGRGLDSNIDFIAVKGNKILALGKKEEMERYIGKETRIISYTRDNLVIPGLHDNHIHLIQAGILEKYEKLYSTTSKEDAARRIARFAETIPDEKWVMGVGFRRMSWEDTSMPDAGTLDAVIADRPVFLMDEELHMAWLNSRGLQECGIDKNTEAPEGGIICRDEKGDPTGVLLENAVALAAKHAFEFDKKTVKQLIEGYIDKAVSLGITSVSDMTPYLSLDLSFPEVYFEMVSNNELKIRVNAARNLFEDINTFNEIRQKADLEGKGFYRVPYMKQFIDGTPANFTGMLLEDYSDNPGEKGKATIDLDKMAAAIETATENNISVRLHSCGDRSCREAINAYENALKKFPETESRHMVEHLELVDPNDIPRFGQLGIICSIQPEHLAAGTMKWEENCYPEKLGPERERYTWPFKQLKDNGAVLAGGTDCPVVEGNLFWGMYAGNTRKYYDDIPEGGWNPQEKLTMPEMIDMFTSGAAYAEHRENELGTLEEGKLADITVVDRNLLELEENPDIRDTKVLLTMVDGRVVYS